MSDTKRPGDASPDDAFTTLPFAVGHDRSIVGQPSAGWLELCARRAEVSARHTDPAEPGAAGAIFGTSGRIGTLVGPAVDDVAKDIADYAEAALFSVTTGDERTEIATKIRNLVRGRLQGGRKTAPRCPIDGCKGRLSLNPHDYEGDSFATCTACKSTRSTTVPLTPLQVAILRHVATFPGAGVGHLIASVGGYKPSALIELELRHLVTVHSAGQVTPTEKGKAELNYPSAGVTP